MCEGKNDCLRVIGNKRGERVGMDERECVWEFLTERSLSVYIRQWKRVCDENSERACEIGTQCVCERDSDRMRKNVRVREKGV